MAYAKLEDLRSRKGDAFLTLAADRNGDGDIDRGAVTAALDDASSVIDSYLAARFTVPLTSPYPSSVVRCACDMAMFYLAERQPVVSDAITKRYDECVKWLRGIKDGEVDPVGASGPIEESSAQRSPRMNAETRVATRTTLDGVM